MLEEGPRQILRGLASVLFPALGTEIPRGIDAMTLPELITCIGSKLYNTMAEAVRKLGVEVPTPADVTRAFGDRATDLPHGAAALLRPVGPLESRRVDFLVGVVQCWLPGAPSGCSGSSTHLQK